MRKHKAIIVDIDQTVSVEKFLDDLPTNNSREEWNDYHKKRQFYTPKIYKPIKEIINLIEGYYNSCYVKPHIIFLTAREDTENGLIRLNTYRFIKKNFSSFKEPQDYGTKYSILMRKKDDFRPSCEVKQDYLNKIVKCYDVLLAFDDEEKNAKMFLDNNITTLQVYSKDFYNFAKGKTNG